MKSEYTNIHTHHPLSTEITPRTAGVHPWQASAEVLAALKPLPEGVQAVGEIGLDYACDVDRVLQKSLLQAQLLQARERGLPVMLHCVRAFEPMLECLAACEPAVVIFHGFIGSPEQAARALDRGYYLSFGERTFASPKSLEALRRTPLDRLFLETDDSATPIETIYARVAAVRELPVEELRRATEANYKRIFGNG